MFCPEPLPTYTDSACNSACTYLKSTYTYVLIYYNRRLPDYTTETWLYVIGLYVCKPLHLQQLKKKPNEFKTTYILFCDFDNCGIKLLFIFRKVE